ncbi:MAG: hypothetical protein IT269_06110 [Saprospiraceae bacterium]|nr:hypothetical protein [Saprospiraceae bacterium]
MNNLEKEFKNRFSEQKQQVEQHESDDLWSAIAKDLDDSPAPVSYFRNLVKISASVLLLAMFIAGAWMFARWSETPGQIVPLTGNILQHPIQNSDVSSGTTTTAEPASLATPDRYPDNVQTSSLNGFEKSPSSNTGKAPHQSMPVPPLKNNRMTSDFKMAVRTTDESIQQHAGADSHFLEEYPKQFLQTSKNQNPAHPTSEQPTGQKDDMLAETASENLLRNPDSGVVPNSLQEGTDARNSTRDTLEKAPLFDPLNLLPANHASLFQNVKRQIMPFKKPAIQPDSKNDEPKQIQKHIGFETGINYTRLLFLSTDKSVLATKKNDTEKPEWGFSAALKTGLLWKNKWALNSGLEYHDYWTVFKTDQKDLPARINRLSRVYIDSSTGNIIRRIYEDTLAPGIATRNIVHYNNYRQISLPLELGMEKHAGKWMFGLNAGAVFSYSFRQTGRTLGNTVPFVDFNQESTVAPLKTFDIGLRIDPVLGYSLNKRVVLMLRPQWSWQQKSFILKSDMRANAHFWEMNVGLRYNLQ